MELTDNLRYHVFVRSLIQQHPTRNEEVEMRLTEDNDSVKTGLNQIAQESFYTRRQLNKTMRSINIKLSLMLLLMAAFFLKTVDLTSEIKVASNAFYDMKGLYLLLK
jgi:hypothetical protein